MIKLYKKSKLYIHSNTFLVIRNKQEQVYGEIIFD